MGNVNIRNVTIQIALNALASGVKNAPLPKPSIPFLLAGSGHCAPPKIKS